MLLVHRVIVHLTRIHDFLLSLIDIRSLSAQDVHDLAVQLMAVQSDGAARLQFPVHDLHLLVGKLLHDIASLTPFEVRHNLLLDILKIYLHNASFY